MYYRTWRLACIPKATLCERHLFRGDFTWMFSFLATIRIEQPIVLITGDLLSPRPGFESPFAALVSFALQSYGQV